MNFDISKSEASEVTKNNLENYKKVKPETDTTYKESKNFVEKIFNKFKEDDSKFEFGGKYVDYETRLSGTPVEGDRGYYEGAERGESKFIPSESNEKGRECKEALNEKGLTGIEYKNAEPDFSKCAEASVSIDHMTEERYGDDGNFAQADRKLAETWNSQEKDGRSDWNEEAISNYRKENYLTWHERCDTVHMDLVDHRIHDYCNHYGGCAECKARDNVGNGGVFDE